MVDSDVRVIRGTVPLRTGPEARPSPEALVADQVAEVLLAHGVTTVFGLMGSGNFIVTHALLHGGARFIGARHEGNGAAMADAYARVSGEIGVCSVSTGPGLTNTITALGEAAKARTPLLVLAGEVPGAAVTNNFRVDQHGAVESVGCIAERIHTPASAAEDTARALRRARVERRPVVLMLPTDVQESPAAGSVPALHHAPAAPAADPVAVDRAVELLLDAERPLILAGRGAVLSDAGPTAASVAEQVGGLLATTAVANGLFADEPYSLGISGGFSTPFAASTIPQADVILVLGASLTYWTTRHGSLIGPEATIIQVDVDAEAIGTSHAPDLAIVADVGSALHAMEQVLADRARRGPTWRTAEMAESIAGSGWNVSFTESAGLEGQIDPRVLSREVDRMLPPNRAVVIDSGHFLGFPAMHIGVLNARAFVFPNAFQAVGLGIGAAVGAAVADPTRPTVLAVGDGGTLMAMGDLESIAQNRLPVLVLVYNDSSAGAEAHHYGPLGWELGLVTFPDVDFAAVAQALRIPALTARSPADLAPLAEWAATLDGPLLVDAKIDKTVVAGWLEEAFRGKAH